MTMGEHQSRMLAEAGTPPSSNLPGQGPGFPDTTSRVTFALCRRTKEEGLKVPASEDLSLWSVAGLLPVFLR